MPKPIKQNKNKRDKAGIERIILEPELVPRKKKFYTEGATNLREANDLPINKSFLIVFITTNSKGEKKFDKKNFDNTWASYIKIAYTCSSIEHWLLLHFEKNTIGFYNSREIIHYFDTKNYFNTQFEKGWYLYKNRDLPIIKDFFKQSYQAIQNNIWLNTFIQSQIKSGKTFYEVSPYSDVFCLVSLLLNQQDMRLAYLNEPISHFDFKDICVSKSEPVITIVFLFDRKQSIFRRNIESLFSLVDENKAPILTHITSINAELIRQGDFVKLEISFSENIDSPFFLVFKEKIKGTEYCLIWLV